MMTRPNVAPLSAGRMFTGRVIFRAAEKTETGAFQVEPPILTLLNPTLLCPLLRL